jgi:hypothetical protein
MQDMLTDISKRRMYTTSPKAFTHDNVMKAHRKVWNYLLINHPTKNTEDLFA